MLKSERERERVLKNEISLENELSSCVTTQNNVAASLPKVCKAVETE